MNEIMKEVFAWTIVILGSITLISLTFELVSFIIKKVSSFLDKQGVYEVIKPQEDIINERDRFIDYLKAYGVISVKIECINEFKEYPNRLIEDYQNGFSYYRVYYTNEFKLKDERIHELKEKEREIGKEILQLESELWNRGL